MRAKFVSFTDTINLIHNRNVALFLLFINQDWIKRAKTWLLVEAWFIAMLPVYYKCQDARVESNEIDISGARIPADNTVAGTRVQNYYSSQLYKIWKPPVIFKNIKNFAFFRKSTWYNNVWKTSWVHNFEKYSGRVSLWIHLDF